VQPRSAEPERRPLGAEGLRFEEDIGEPVMPTLEGCRAHRPGAPPRGQVLVEPLAALPVRDAQRRVFVAMPADRRLHDETASGEQVERRELLRQEQRMAKRWDHGAGDQADALGRCCDRGQQQEGARPRCPRVLVLRQRIVPRVLGLAGLGGARPEHDVLAHHHRVEPRVLRVRGHPYERPQVVRWHEGPVLAEDQDQLRRRHGTSGTRIGLSEPDPRPHPVSYSWWVRSSGSATRAGSRPLTANM
jgi:hypothetical protein